MSIKNLGDLRAWEVGSIMLTIEKSIERKRDMLSNAKSKEEQKMIIKDLELSKDRLKEWQELIKQPRV